MAPAGSVRGCPGTMLAVEDAEVLQGHRGSGARPGLVPAAGGAGGRAQPLSPLLCCLPSPAEGEGSARSGSSACEPGKLPTGNCRSFSFNTVPRCIPAL